MASYFTKPVLLTVDGKQFLDAKRINVSDMPSEHQETFAAFVQGFREASGIGNRWQVKHVILSDSSKAKPTTETNEDGTPKVEHVRAIALEMHAQHDDNHTWAAPDFLLIDNQAIIDLFEYIQNA